MTPTTLLDAVRPYAAAVRAELADLPPETIDDLTDGLEADLMAALEDDAEAAPPDGVDLVAAPARMLDLADRFGPPAAYAAELRAAAGIGPAVARPAGRERRRMRDRADRIRQAVTTQPWWPGVAEFLDVMRPAGWAVRGWVLFGVVSALLGGMIRADRAWVPDSLLRWVLLGALVVLSAQWGRGRIPAGKWRLRLGRFATVLAVVLLLPAMVSATQPEIRWQEVYAAEESWEPPGDGVVVDGMQVSNLFVYDAEGTLVPGAQVFDDRGRPVATVTDAWAEWSLPGVEEPWRFAPVTDENGRVRWNVYPLLGAPFGQWEGGNSLSEGYELAVPPLPFAQAPEVPSGADEAKQPTDDADGA